MIPWDNVTISARAPITKANKRLRSLTVGAGRHGMAVSRGLVAQNGRCIRCFASPLTNRASACGMAAQVQIDQQRINGTPLQTPPYLQYTAHASCSKHRSVVPGDASGNARASVSPDLLGLQFGIEAFQRGRSCRAAGATSYDERRAQKPGPVVRPTNDEEREGRAPPARRHRI